MTLPQVPKRALANLRNVDEGLAARVASGLGVDLPEKAKAAREPINMRSSPALSIHKNAKHTVNGRNVAILINDGSDAEAVKSLKSALKDQGSRVTIVAPKAHGIKLSDGSSVHVDGALTGMPSALFDATAVVLSRKGTEALLGESAAVQWVQDAYGHLKAIGYTSGSVPLLKKAGISLSQDGVVSDLNDRFVKAAGRRFWSREHLVRTLY